MSYTHRLILILGIGLLLLSSIASDTRAAAQAAASEDTALRDRAFWLWEQNNYTEAPFVREKLASAHPSDTVISERLGFALAASTASAVPGYMRDPVSVSEKTTLSA